MQPDIVTPGHPTIWVGKAEANVSVGSCLPTNKITENCSLLLTTMVSVIPGLLRGKSRIALAVTEPDAGSDVAGLQTEAKISEDGKHLIINGQKKVGI